MNLPETNEIYGDRSYWDERYTAEEEFDWFADYSSFRHIIFQSVNKSDKILHLGCGNSLLPVKMFEDGYTNIVNVDYSPVVIDKMKAKYGHLTGMSWIVADATNMTSLPASSFDVIIEKGTLDAMLVQETNPWQLTGIAEATIESILEQVVRLLQPSGGRFISITFAQPHFRVPLYVGIDNQYGWDVSVSTFGTGFEYFCYTMTRGLTPSDYHNKLRREYDERKTKQYQVTYVSDSDDDDFLLDAFNFDST